jgi:hypothetical protein
MIEEAVKNALSNFNQTLLGSVYIITLFSTGLGFRFLIKIIDELKADLKAERDAHNATRAAQIEDIRNMSRVAETMSDLRDSIRDLSVRRVAGE